MHLQIHIVILDFIRVCHSAGKIVLTILKIVQILPVMRRSYHNLVIDDAW